MRIAVLDTASAQQQLIGEALAQAGHDCRCFTGQHTLLPALMGEGFHLLLVDWDQPDLADGAFLQRLRVDLSLTLPIMLMSHRRAEADLIEALGAGADDLVGKPLRLPELQARVQALLRRAQLLATADPPQDFGRYRFLPAARMLLKDGRPVELKSREYALALLLFQNQGRLLSRDYLHATLWGTVRDDGSRSLDTHVSRIRHKLDLRPQCGYVLSAIYGVGYRLEMVDGPAALTPSGAGTGAPV